MTIFFILLLIKFSEKLSLIDVPNQRSVHKKSVPRGAGIAFTGTSLFAIWLFFPSHFTEYYYIYLSICIVWISGILDDLFDISPYMKLIFILIASVVLFYKHFYLTTLGTYFGYTINIPVIVTYFFTFFALAGFTNALNLMDGLDGLAGSISLVMFIAFLIIGIYHKDALLTILSAAFVVSLLAFLLFNWHPGKIFMGDSGSLSIGFSLSILAVEATKYISPSAVLFIIAMPLLDTFIVMTRRKQRHLSLFTADKNHLHHFLYNVKGDVSFTVIILTMMQVIFSIIGVQLQKSNNMITIILFVLLFIVYLNLFDQRLKRRKKRK